MNPVSIHAPLRREERRFFFVRGVTGSTFQSTPPSEERSDSTNDRWYTSQAAFQSTPPSEERSDLRWPVPSSL